MNTISSCLNLIDCIISSNIEKGIGIEILKMFVITWFEPLMINVLKIT